MKPSRSWDALSRDLRRITRGGVKENEPMSAHTTLGVGGAARILITPASTGQVVKIVRYAHRNAIPYFVLGKGSNLIVRDGGYDGLVISMGARMCRVRVNKLTVFAEGGASFARLARTMTKQGRTGLEFGVGIPGTVGGAVKMNAGAFGGEIKDVLRRVRLVEREGNVTVLKADQLEFGYRRSHLPQDSIVLSATLNCAPGPVRQEVYQRSIRRKETQPIWERCFGSTFVNPPGDFAARMIEGCGLKGHRRGGAMISDMHANFIINVDGKARASDVEGLIGLMKREVKKKYGVALKTEVIVLGHK